MHQTIAIIVNFKNEYKTIGYVKDQLSKLKISHVVIVNNLATSESNKFLSEKLHGIIITDIAAKPLNNYCYILPQIENLGFAKGNNLGAEFSNNHLETDYILFTNNDIRIISTNVIDVLIEKMELNQDIGMIGPNCIGIDGISQSPRPYLSFWTLFILRYWISPFVTKKLKNSILKDDYALKAQEGDHYKLSGSFFIVRNKDFLNCGMMDPNTFLYCEEEILTERMYLISKRVFYIPEVTVLHEHGQTIGKYFNNKRIQILDFKSNIYYYKNYKNVSNFSILLGKLNFYIVVFLKTLKNKIKWKIVKQD